MSSNKMEVKEFVPRDISGDICANCGQRKNAHLPPPLNWCPRQQGVDWSAHAKQVYRDPAPQQEEKPKA
jgi:hypothetical protein